MENLDCAACAANLERGIKKLDCVRSVSINFATQSMNLDTDDPEVVIQEMKRIEPDIRVIQRNDIIRSKSSIFKFDPSSNKKEQVSSTDSIAETKLFISAHTQKKEQVRDKGTSLINWRDIGLLVIVSGLYILAMCFDRILSATPYHWAEYFVFLSIYWVVGKDVLRKAFRHVLRLDGFDENVLMSLATIGAIIIHALPEAVGVMLFYQIGEFFQKISINRSRRSIQALLAVRPDYANLKVDGEEKRVVPDEVVCGDVVVVRPGEKIPLDGIIVHGKTQVETSALTGESVPRGVSVKDTVLAGMINLSGLIEVQVSRVYGESSISKILDLVENATEKKAKTEQFFSVFARYYTPVVFAMALLTAVLPPLISYGADWSVWIYRALVILVISCPCALVVSIPLVYFGGIGAASRRGILVKGSDYLESLRKVKTVVLDKTGTLTCGHFKVSNIVSCNGISCEQLLEYAAKAESHSNHPIAQSVMEAARQVSHRQPVHSELIGYEEISGQGIKAREDNQVILAGNEKLMRHFGIPCDVPNVVGTVVHVAVNNEYKGYLLIGDELKSDTEDAIRQMRKVGVRKIVMLTGDRNRVALEIATKLKLDQYYSDLMPEDKVKYLEQIIQEEKGEGKVLFVGDGINDAPVLARADIGVSMGKMGADAAIETADIVVMNDSLKKIPEAILLSGRVRRILIQNVAFALGIKFLLIALGFLGMASMWEAVFGDVGVTLLAILNATRVFL